MKKMFLIILSVLAFAQAHSCAPFRPSRSARVENSLFWGVFGDTLGAPVEFIPSVEEILRKPGYDYDFLKDNYSTVITTAKGHYKGHYKEYGFDYIPYTDDTRMTLLVLQEVERINREKPLFGIEESVLTCIARVFQKDFEDKTYGWAATYRVPGISTIKAIQTLPKNLQTSKSQVWQKNKILLPQLSFADSNNNVCGGGCGSVMHAAPFGYFKDFWQYSAEHSKITHNHPVAIASCISLARGIDCMINEKHWTKDAIIKEMIEIADKYERDAVCQDDIENDRYEFRMRRILEAALNAAKKMEKIKNSIAACTCLLAEPSGKKSYLSFHSLMSNNEFRKEHISMFPKSVSADYTYDTAEFIGWDAATCLAAAIYNFYLWIPENINELDKQERTHCLTNAITSAMIIGGDSDSVASVTGQLCGAFVSTLTTVKSLKDVTEDSSAIYTYAQNIK